MEAARPYMQLGDPAGGPDSFCVVEVLIAQRVCAAEFQIGRREPGQVSSPRRSRVGGDGVPLVLRSQVRVCGTGR
jgi:hypothetical protein